MLVILKMYFVEIDLLYFMYTYVIKIQSNMQESRSCNILILLY